MKQRLNWLDIAKGIAILTVIIGHVGQISWEPYRKFIFSFHMPLFFVAAGYTAKGITRGAVWKSVTRLLVPYFIACVLTGIVRIISFDSDVITEIRRTLWGSGVPALYGPGIPITGEESIPSIGAIWFLPCLFFSKLFFSAFLTITESLKMWIKTLLVLAISSLGYIIGMRYKLPFCIDVALFNTFFFYAGYLFRKYNGIAKKSISLGVVFLVLWYLSLKNNALELSARFYRDFPACIFTILGGITATFTVFHFSEEVADRIKGLNSFLVWCGKYSMNILLIHHFDGLLFKYFWFTDWLGDISSLAPLMQGAIISVQKIAVYIIMCGIYVQVKKVIVKKCIGEVAG